MCQQVGNMYRPRLLDTGRDAAAKEREEDEGSKRTDARTRNY
jgi:hypothetical protein